MENPKKNLEGYSDPTAYNAIKRISSEGQRSFYRGDVWYVDNTDSYGFELGGLRPAVIVSNDMGNWHGKCLEIVYLSRGEKKPLPTHVPVCCKEPSTAMCENIDTRDKERFKEYIGTLSRAEMEAIDDALRVSLALKLPEKREEKETANSMPSPAIAPNTANLERITRLQTERDIFKSLYEDLLARLTETRG